MQDHPEEYHIEWGNISDNQKILYNDLAIETLADILSCNLSYYEYPSHHRKLDYIHSTLVESLQVSTSPLNRSTQHRRRQIPAWNWYGKDLHADGRKHFLNRYRNSRVRNNALFEAMKSS